MTVNVEKVVVGHLLADTALTELLGANRVSTEIPPGADLPRVRVTLTGGTIPVRGWLYSHRVTIEGWAENKDDAWEATVLAVASLERDLDGALVEGGVVSAVDQESGATWVPDPESNLPRYLVTVRVTVHPEP